MKNNINNAIEWIKSQEYVKGCITGSTLLEIFPDSNQDIDVFLYNKSSFIELFYAMLHNDMFTMLDPLDKWKSFKFRTNDNDYNKSGIHTIKFMWNTCIPVNIILKKNSTDIFSTLSSFDMDIISKGYDIETKQYMDLTNGSTITKVASWNKWNPVFYNPELWEISRILRQLERCFKYYKRGYNTDAVVLKYIELIDKIQEFENIFNSDNFTEQLKIRKANTKLVKKICLKWLETHNISEEEIELMKIKMREI